jgi:hypothetical protein
MLFSTDKAGFTCDDTIIRNQHSWADVNPCGNCCHIGSSDVFQLRGAVNHGFVQNTVS